jgi:hypothetical protein
MSDLPVVGTAIGITNELLRVATGTAALAGLYYTVAMVVNSQYREESVSGITDEIRATLAERNRYLRLLGAGATTGRSVPRSASGV